MGRRNFIAFLAAAGVVAFGGAAILTAALVKGSERAESSPFVRPIERNPEIDVNSPRYADLLSRAASGINVNQGAWTPSVFRASSSSPEVSVAMANGWRIDGVPWPEGAEPSPDSDGHLVILDESAGCEYDFFRARRHADGSVSAEGEATFRIGGSGVHEPWSARASGFALTAGLITPEDVAAGEIDHALAIAIPVTAPSFVSPATTSDGRTEGGIPMGTHFQLDPSLDLAKLGLEPGEETLAKAMQVYGLYVVDTSDAVALFAQNTNSTGGYRYPASWSDGITGRLLRHLRALAPPARPRLDSWTFRGCAQRHLAS